MKKTVAVIARAFVQAIINREDIGITLRMTPRIMNVPEESEQLRQTDNRFYRNYNQNYPQLREFDNKFIDVDKSAEQSDIIPQSLQSDSFQEMTNYAAQMVRTPEVQRPQSQVYETVRVIPVAAGLFSEPAIKTVPTESRRTGSLYVTAVSLFNRSNKVIEISRDNLRGPWLTAAMEASKLSPSGSDDAASMLYLVSEQPFDDVITAINQMR